MFGKVQISLKYKFLGVMMLVLLSSLGVFFALAQDTFSEDKKLFVMDLNRTLLKATTSEIKLELRGRLEELQVFVPRVYRAGEEKYDPFTGLSDGLRTDLLGVTFYKRDGTEYKPLRWYLNPAAQKDNGLASNILSQLNDVHPIDFSQSTGDGGTQILNRSVNYNEKDLTIISFVLSGSFLNDQSAELIIVVDLMQRFLLAQLQQSEIAEVFLIYRDGRLLSHPSLSKTVAYASRVFPHPITQSMGNERFSRESLELEVNGEEYLCNISETGFKDIFAVSQTLKSEAFLALQTLLHKSALLAILVLSAAVGVSVFFAAGLTSNIQKLRRAAEQIGAGNLDVKLSVSSNDEIRSVAKSFQWMVNRLKTLVEESLEKARLADELETARLVQSTLLTPPEVATDSVKIVSKYEPATECGGDYWDAHFDGQRVTVFIGDATGHGAPAAIVTAVAKSCFATINTFSGGGMTPEEMLNVMNEIIYFACRGKLLMTMCVVQLDVVTGELTVANAGHEAPMCLRKAAEEITDEKERRKKAVETFFAAQGERLGFDPNVKYVSEKVQLMSGDIVLLYTDGISEAKNEEGKEWGERALKKVFASRGQAVLDEIRDTLMVAVKSHCGEAVQEDDITFVLLEFKKALEAGDVKLVPATSFKSAAFTAAESAAAASPPVLSRPMAPPIPAPVAVPVMVPPPVAQVPVSPPPPPPPAATMEEFVTRVSNLDAFEATVIAPESKISDLAPEPSNAAISLADISDERDAALMENRDPKEISEGTDKEGGPAPTDSDKSKAA